MLLNPYRFGVVLPPSALLTDLVSYWKMDEASGNAIDSHGSNTLTDINTVGSVGGKLGNARDFEKDTDEYFTIASNASLQVSATSFTIAMWMKFETFATEQAIIGKDGNASNREYGIYYTPGQNRIRAFVTSNGTTQSNVTSDNLGAPVVGVWYFIVFWYDRTVPQIYLQINDGGINQAAAGATVYVGTANFRIGAWDSSPSRPVDGLIDEVGFWKRILTPAERTQLYNGSYGVTYPTFLPLPADLLRSLVSYWKMDEASGNALDAHGTNHLTDNNTVGTTAGKVGNARNFVRASNEYFTCVSGDSLSMGDTDFTFAVWVKPTLGTSGIISKWINAGSQNEFYLLVDSARFNWHVKGATESNVDNGAGITFGIWHHLIVWHDSVNNQIGMIWNGGAARLTSYAGGVNSFPTAVFNVGAVPGGTSSTMDGVIDELGFWRRILTLEERTELYNAGNGKTYPFT